MPKGAELPKCCSASEMLVSGVNFAIEIAKIRQSVHGQAMFVLFAADVHFHQMPRKPVTSPLRFATVSERAVYAERAVNEQNIH
jgi:hypothetical protein